jgi:hypothetical protein
MPGGQPLVDVSEPDVASVERGMANPEKCVESIRKFGRPEPGPGGSRFGFRSCGGAAPAPARL